MVIIVIDFASFIAWLHVSQLCGPPSNPSAIPRVAASGRRVSARDTGHYAAWPVAASPAYCLLHLYRWTAESGINSHDAPLRLSERQALFLRRLQCSAAGGAGLGTSLCRH